MNEMRGGRGPNRGLLLLIPAALILAKAAKHRRQAMWESAEGEAGAAGGPTRSSRAVRASRMVRWTRWIPASAEDRVGARRLACPSPSGDRLGGDPDGLINRRQSARDARMGRDRRSGVRPSLCLLRPEHRRRAGRRPGPGDRHPLDPRPGPRDPDRPARADRRTRSRSSSTRTATSTMPTATTSSGRRRSGATSGA